MITGLLKRLAKLAWFLPGFLLWAAFPPMQERMDCLIALAPLLWLSRRGDAKIAFRRWYLAGFVFWVATLSWMPAIVKNGGPWPLVVLGWFALAAYCALFFGAFGFVCARFWSVARQRDAYWTRLVGILFFEPILWAGLELVRSRLFGGFSWNQLGIVPANSGFGAPAAWGGVYLLSAVIILINGTLASIAERVLAPVLDKFAPKTVPNWTRSCETVLPFLLIWGIYSLPVDAVSHRVNMDGSRPHSDAERLRVYGDAAARRVNADGSRSHSDAERLRVYGDAAARRVNADGSRPHSDAERLRVYGDAARLRVGLVQRNFPCCFKENGENPYAAYARLLAPLESFKPDLIVLSESALSEFGAVGSAGAARFVRFVAGKTGAALLAGGTREANGKLYNTAALYSAQDPSAPGAFLSPQTYDKVHLVPFGEFVPGDKTFPFLQNFAPVGSCTSGVEKFLVLEKACGEDIPLGVSICYEDTDSAQVCDFARAGARALVFITNDSWFSGSVETLQHAWQARVRAIETGLDVVRVGNSGVSGIIRPDGSTELLRGADGRPLVDAPGTMCARVDVSERPPTFYVRYGDKPLAVLFALLKVLMILIEYLAHHEKRRTLSL